jgi:hypothetical protein
MNMHGPALASATLRCSECGALVHLTNDDSEHVIALLRGLMAPVRRMRFVCGACDSSATHGAPGAWPTR